MKEMEFESLQGEFKIRDRTLQTVEQDFNQVKLSFRSETGDIWEKMRQDLERRKGQLDTEEGDLETKAQNLALTRDRVNDFNLNFNANSSAFKGEVDDFTLKVDEFDSKATGFGLEITEISSKVDGPSEEWSEILKVWDNKIGGWQKKVNDWKEIVGTWSKKFERWQKKANIWDDKNEEWIEEFEEWNAQFKEYKQWSAGSTDVNRTLSVGELRQQLAGLGHQERQLDEFEEGLQRLDRRLQRGDAGVSSEDLDNDISEFQKAKEKIHNMEQDLDNDISEFQKAKEKISPEEIRQRGNDIQKSIERNLEEQEWILDTWQGNLKVEGENLTRRRPSVSDRIASFKSNLREEMNELQYDIDHPDNSKLQSMFKRDLQVLEQWGGKVAKWEEGVQEMEERNIQWEEDFEKLAPSSTAQGLPLSERQAKLREKEEELERLQRDLQEQNRDFQALERDFIQGQRDY